MIFVFFLVGSAGIIIPRTHQLFLSLFPFALILSLFLLLLYHRPLIDGRTLLSLLIIGVAGFFIEVAGVETHFVFGNYSYGNSLGLKIFDTPVLIGINWIMLIYATGSVSARLSNNSLINILT
ncbi:MAG TPA: carotenoid biosynthesis protein, partial [Bacteroidales bacterium]|nr:carotenoid biosynthesis protein [Bacteroidales bacterium]